MGTEPVQGGGGQPERTVLIVEDEAATRELLKATVKGTGIPCHIYESSTSDQALELGKRVRPDLVLLDIVLPGSEVSGVMLCQQFCRDSRTKVVVVSGQAEEMIIEALLREHAESNNPPC